MAKSYSADLHIHGTYSGATSDKMVPEVIAQQASLKGLALVGTGDFLNPKWMDLFQEKLVRVEEGTFKHPKYRTRFILTVEVEDDRRVHHLIILPSVSAAGGLREEFSVYSNDINLDGRPTIDLSAPEIVDISKDYACLVGPCHAFTPWTSIYKEFDSLRECYGDQADRVDFLELGLSADTFMADRIKELNSVPFLSNSDAHSPWPNRLAREFNRFELSRPVASDLIKAIRDKDISLNVGLDPRLGKYHMTACSRCHAQLSVADAKINGWCCEECGGRVKKGVSDRIDELADFESPSHPDFRPDYIRIAPLSEVVALALGLSSPRSRKVHAIWNSLVEEFGDEITVLVDAPISEIAKVSDSGVASVIQAFRGQHYGIDPGGGGRYGSLKVSRKIIEAGSTPGQRRLVEFG